MVAQAFTNELGTYRGLKQVQWLDEVFTIAEHTESPINLALFNNEGNEVCIGELDENFQEAINNIIVSELI